MWILNFYFSYSCRPGFSKNLDMFCRCVDQCWINHHFFINQIGFFILISPLQSHSHDSWPIPREENLLEGWEWIRFFVNRISSAKADSDRVKILFLKILKLLVCTNSYSSRKSWKEDLSRDGICKWFWDSSKFESFSFLFISARKIDHLSKFWDSSLFLVRKFCSEFESFLPRIHLLFEFWAI